MGIIKRTYVSITKRIGKSLILLLLVFIVANIIAGAFSVKTASSQLNRTMKEQIGAKVRIDQNLSSMPSTAIDSITHEVADKIALLPEVKSVDYEIELGMGSDTLKKYSTNENYIDDEFSFVNFTFIGSKTDKPSNFVDGSAQLLEGSMPSLAEDSNEIIVTKTLAELNNLKIGDTVAFYLGNVINDMQNKRFTVEEKIPFEFKIVGLYENTNTSTGMDAEYQKERSANTIYTNMGIVNTLDDLKSNFEFTNDTEKTFKTAEEYRTPVIPTYELNSIDDVESFVSKASTMIDLDAYKFTTSQDELKSISGTISNMENLSNLILIFGTVAAILILSLVLFLFLRERKYEFGIYQALGEKKVKSVLQVVLEVLIIAIISITLSIYSGQEIAKGISTQMITTQQADTQDTVNIPGFDPIPQKSLSDIEEEDLLNNLQISMDSDYFIGLYGLVLSVSLISILISSIYVLRLNPRETLL